MTGRDLLQILQNSPNELLDDFDLSVCVDGEYYMITGITITDNSDNVLDEGSPVLLTNCYELEESPF